MRIFIPVRRRKSHIFQKCGNLFMYGPRICRKVTNRICHGLSDFPSRIKRTVGILKYHLYLPVNLFLFLPRQAHNGLAVKKDISVRRPVQTRHKFGNRRFSASAFSDNSQFFLIFQIKGNIFQRFDKVAFFGKCHVQILAGQYRICHHFSSSVSSLW